jgi:hypothetical protein
MTLDQGEGRHTVSLADGHDQRMETKVHMCTNSLMGQAAAQIVETETVSSFILLRTRTEETLVGTSLAASVRGLFPHLFEGQIFTAYRGT